MKKDKKIEPVETENNAVDTEKEEKISFKEKVALRFRKGFLTSKVNTILIVIILISLFAIINTWAQSKDLMQIDVTENKLYSLTQASKDQLKNLDKEVHVYIYGYEETSTYVDFVKQYTAFNSNIKHEIVTSETNYEIITKYDLSDLGYNAMVIECGDKYKVLYPDYEFATTEYVNGVYEEVDLTEENITNAILNVSTDDPVKVYFTAGNGEYTVSQVSTLIAYLEAQVYECEELNLMSVAEIPADCDVLAILDPTTDISTESATIIKNYIAKGGNIFFGMTKMNETTDFSNLQSVLDLYGATIDYGVLYEDNANNSLTYNGASYPYILMPNASSSHKISEDLDESGYTTVFPWTQKVTLKSVEEENVTVSNQELLYTSNKCYALTDIGSGLNIDGVEPSSYTIGARVEREVTTPATDTTEESTIVSTLIILGNANFLADSFQIGQLQLNPISFPGNASFALNCFADLAEQEDLITVRKAANVTTFTSTSMEDMVVKAIIFVIPVLIIIVGIIIWNIRRRKR